MTPTVEILPQILLCHTGELNQANMISVRSKPGQSGEARKEIKSILNRYLPGAIVDPEMMEDSVANEVTVRIYRSVADSIAFFAVISIIIAVVGLFSMVSFSSRQRVKEVGIRKVMGASSMMIYREMIRTYLKFYLIAVMVAVPATLYLGNSDPAFYRPGEDPWLFVFTLAGALTVILLTISTQILQTARTNPADSLRDE
jgi:ABC-type antimicrobial peptide transport system permease subunit